MTYYLISVLSMDETSTMAKEATHVFIEKKRDNLLSPGLFWLSVEHVVILGSFREIF